MKMMLPSEARLCEHGASEASGVANHYALSASNREIRRNKEVYDYFRKKVILLSMKEEHSGYE